MFDTEHGRRMQRVTDTSSVISAFNSETSSLSLDYITWQEHQQQQQQQYRHRSTSSQLTSDNNNNNDNDDDDDDNNDDAENYYAGTYRPTQCMSC